MQTLKYGSLTYQVDHATKGADYIHGYDAAGRLVVAFDGVADFSAFEYSGEYMSPTECFEERCNNTKCVDGRLLRSDGTDLLRLSIGEDATAYAPGSLAAGKRIVRNGANITYDENGRQYPVAAADWRFNEAYGYGSEAFGKGAVAYSRASKSLGYRTQTGYPLNLQMANARPEAIRWSGKVLDVEAPVGFYGDVMAFPGEVKLSKEAYDAYVTYTCVNSGTVGFTVSAEFEEGEDTCNEMLILFKCDDKEVARIEISEPGSSYVEAYIPPGLNSINIQITDVYGLPCTAILREFVFYPGDNVGQGAVALGADTMALENHALAGGWGSIARGASSFAFGDHNEAIGYASFASGINNKAHSAYAVSFGNTCESLGLNSFTCGDGSRTNGHNAIAMGYRCKAFGDSSVAIGSANTAGVEGSTGVKFSIAMGKDCAATASCATAIGHGCIANAYGQTAVGRYNIEDAKALFTVGMGTSNTDRRNAFMVDNGGNARVAGALHAGNGVNGVYMQSVRVWGTSTFIIHTKYSEWSDDEAGNRQSFHIFGSNNGTPVQGTISVNGASDVAWVGTDNVVLQTISDGRVVVELAAASYDHFIVISAEKFSV